MMSRVPSKVGSLNIHLPLQFMLVVLLPLPLVHHLRGVLRREGLEALRGEARGPRVDSGEHVVFLLVGSVKRIVLLLVIDTLLLLAHVVDVAGVSRWLLRVLVLGRMLIIGPSVRSGRLLVSVCVLGDEGVGGRGRRENLLGGSFLYI